MMFTISSSFSSVLTANLLYDDLSPQKLKTKLEIGPKTKGALNCFSSVLFSASSVYGSVGLFCAISYKSFKSLVLRLFLVHVRNNRYETTYSAIAMPPTLPRISK